MNKDDVVIFQGFFEFGTSDDVVVALAPRCSVVRVIDGNGLHLYVVVSKMDDELGYTGLQILYGVGVEIFPACSRDGGIGDLDGIQEHVFAGKKGRQGGRSVGTDEG